MSIERKTIHVDDVTYVQARDYDLIATLRSPSARVDWRDGERDWRPHRAVMGSAKLHDASLAVIGSSVPQATIMMLDIRSMADISDPGSITTSSLASVMYLEGIDDLYLEPAWQCSVHLPEAAFADIWNAIRAGANEVTLTLRGGLFTDERLYDSFLPPKSTTWYLETVRDKPMSSHGVVIGVSARNASSAETSALGVSHQSDPEPPRATNDVFPSDLRAALLRAASVVTWGMPLLIGIGVAIFMHIR